MTEQTKGVESEKIKMKRERERERESVHMNPSVSSINQQSTKLTT